MLRDAAVAAYRKASEDKTGIASIATSAAGAR